MTSFHRVTGSVGAINTGRAASFFVRSVFADSNYIANVRSNQYAMTRVSEPRIANSCGRVCRSRFDKLRVTHTYFDGCVTTT